MCREPIPFIPARPDQPQQDFTDEGWRIGREIQDGLFEVQHRAVVVVQRREPQETETRRERAIRGIQQNGQTRAEARQVFLHLRENVRIPGNAMFGGVHQRKCGVRTCERRTGAGGVRFLKLNEGKRKYRCETCYYAETGDTPAEAPTFVGM